MNSGTRLSGSRLTFLSLFMVLLIDGIAQGILIPILTNTVIHPSEFLAGYNFGMAQRNLLYGLILGVFFICWFLGAPVISTFSDVVGRKRCLLVCLWGTLVGFILTALAFVFNSLTLIFLGRIIDGLTAGGQAVAKATVIDICPENERARYIAFMILAVTIGMILGPIIGGVLSDSELIVWTTPAFPLYVAGFLTCINIVFLQFCFTESRSCVSGERKNTLLTACSSLITAFRDKKIAPLMLIFLLLMIGWTSYQFYTTSFLAQFYQLHGLYNSVFFVAVGVGSCLGFLSVGWFERRNLNIKSVVICGYAILAAVMILTVTIHNRYLVWLFTVVGTYALAQGYSFMMRIISGLASAERQGWVMGVASSSVALAAAIAILVSGPLTGWGIAAPLWVDVLLILLGLFGLALWNRHEGAANS